MTYNPDFPDYVPADEEAASAAGLELAPWVASMAAPIRDRHLAKRAAEGAKATKSKVRSWRRGDSCPISPRPMSIV